MTDNLQKYSSLLEGDEMQAFYMKNGIKVSQIWFIYDRSSPTVSFRSCGWQSRSALSRFDTRSTRVITNYSPFRITHLLNSSANLPAYCMDQERSLCQVLTFLFGLLTSCWTHSTSSRFSPWVYGIGRLTLSLLLCYQSFQPLQSFLQCMIDGPQIGAFKISPNTHVRSKFSNQMELMKSVTAQSCFLEMS